MFSADLGAVPAADAAYIEDVFSTFLYAGNGSTQTINNGIDLAGKGGLVWIKRRNVDNHRLVDTARGVNWALQSNTTSGQDNSFQSVTAFNSNGFTVGSGSAVNSDGSPIASWTFREQPKFFDIVTYTGNGVPGRSIDHSLGSVPGAIIVKATSTTGDWLCNHRSVSGGDLTLNSTAAATGTVNTITLPVSNARIVGNSSGVFIAYTSGTTTYYTSTNNGASWTTRTFPNSNYSTNIITSAGIYFYATRTSSPFQAAVSSDGVSWSSLSGVSGIPTFSAHNTVSNGYMLVTQNPAALYFSSNGTSFSSVTQPVSSVLPTIAALPEANSWIFSQSTTTSVYYTTSNNGASWTVRNFPSSGGWTLGGAGGYVLRSSGSFDYAWTVDGVNWTPFSVAGSIGGIGQDSVKYLNGWFFFRDANGFIYKTNLADTSQVSSISPNSYGATNTRVLYRTSSGTTAFTVDTGGSRITNISSTTFSPGLGYNDNGVTYVAYLFAHDAGGFGATGADNVISCGSFTTDGSGNATVNLGYEPQWILYKPSSSVGNWEIADVMRGWSNTSISRLYPDSSSSEQTYTANTPNAPNATGFQFTGLLNASSTYIYIAIRRGPMRTPTTGTSVYTSQLRTGTGAATTVSGFGFPIDLYLMQGARSGTARSQWRDRLRGSIKGLESSSTSAEYDDPDAVTAFTQNGFTLGVSTDINTSGSNYVDHVFRRAPGFLDVVCYTGTGGFSARSVNHNLATVPELIICKSRSGFGNWWVYAAPIGNTRAAIINGTQGFFFFDTSTNWWGQTTPTSSVFYVGSPDTTNQSGIPQVAYLFASCPGVSKVGSYTGTGNTQTINCDFSSGARFVLIKRTDSTGDWYVWDSARGIVAGNDPYLLLNSTAAEVTNTDWVDPAASGFELSNSGGNLVNINGASYIFLSVA